MKKNYFMLALASMMMAACANNDLVDEGVVKEEAPQAIEFEPFANKTSRAEIVDANSLKTTNGGFHVWGYKSSDSWSNEYCVFDGANVSWINSGWDYSDYSGGPQYWDKTSNYHFYAVAPKAPAGVNYSIDDDKAITITGVQSPIDAASMDYLIVRPDDVDEIDGSIKAPVSLTFTHIMSKISFKLKAGINEKIVVTSLSMYGWNNGTATFTQDANSEWAFTTNSVVSEGSAISILSTDTELPYDNTLATQNATSTTVGNSFIMVPQTITYTPASPAGVTPEVSESGLTFIVSYKIVRGEGTNAVEEVFTNQVGILKANQTWSTNTHTTYTIIVGPDAIVFGDPVINSWTPGSADGNLSF